MSLHAAPLLAPLSSRLFGALVLSLAGLVACGGDDERDPIVITPPAPSPVVPDFRSSPGRLLGFLVDGLSGRPINLFGDDNLGPTDPARGSVRALVDGAFRRGRACEVGDFANDPGFSADGCYQVTDIPPDTDVPVFAVVPGYAPFAGQVIYPAPDPEVPLERQNRQLIANIRVFPLGYGFDYRVRPAFGGRAVPGAEVRCQYLPSSSNPVGVDGVFLSPVNTGSGVVRAAADAEGLALLRGADLILGARYQCEVSAADPLEGRALTGELSLIAGVSRAEQPVLLSAGPAPDGALYALYSSADAPDRIEGPDTPLRIVFNRPVEIVPHTEDCQVATLSAPDTDGDGVTGATPPNAVGGGSETVRTTLSPDGLVLTATYVLSSPLDPGDTGARVLFDGIVVRPRGGESRVVRYVGAVAGCTAATVYGTQAPLRNDRTGGLQNNAVDVS